VKVYDIPAAAAGVILDLNLDFCAVCKLTRMRCKGLQIPLILVV
jgi:hypothetical protein